ncbi:MAG: Gfo/Idh/MocA family oxidoreductase [Candidatus Vogelbacteria bacterium]|nr:Gfo/Idh/MocA family oxidoreductase [Candidatus Vogelbacteria bacterium]
MATVKAKIFGAGSIGNHLTQAARRAGWEVVLVDADKKALERTKKELYPKRYGAWDEGVTLATLKDMPIGGFDVIMVGTPPDTHMQLATEILKKEAPKVLQIEKPLCTPTLKGLKEFIAEALKHPKTKIVVGYNHLLAENTLTAENIISREIFKDILSIDCEFRSHWENIFKAHPWLEGPHDTYLGFWERGGGSGAEHSHGVNIWQHFAHVLGAGRIALVSATIDIVKAKKGAEYDRSFFVQFVTDKGVVGRLAQDVITQPKKKFVEMQFGNGSLLWDNDVSKTTDEVVSLLRGKEPEKIVITKSRPDEFFHEIKHLEKLFTGEMKYKDSPIRLKRSVETMLVVAAAFESNKKKKAVKVNYALADKLGK